MVVKGTVEVDTRRAERGLKKLDKESRLALNKIAYRICLEVKEQVTTNTLRGGVFKSKGIFNDLRIYMSGRNPEVLTDGAVYGLPKGANATSKQNSVGLKMGDIGLFFERGGTVRPRNAKMLRIPLPPALTPGGYDREMGVALRNEKGSSGYFPFKSKKGNLLLGKTGEGTKPYYYLTGSATIKGRPWFADAVKQVKSRLSTIVPKEFRRYVNVERT